MQRRIRTAVVAAVAVVATAFAGSASAASYNPITPTKAGTTITLDGKSLTIEQVVDVARHGAKVRLTDAARQKSLDAYELLLQGAREGIPIYFFNRGTGANRTTVIFEGDPLSPENEAFLLQRQLTRFRNGAASGLGPEVADEEIVRAMMVVRANTMVYEAASPQLTQRLLDLINKRITPVVQSRGSPGEGDLPQMSNVAATMVGAGDAYLNGVRMSASEALARAGLQPLAPFAADDAALVSTNAFTMGQAALLVHDTKKMLDWAELSYAMDMVGMNSSVTPIASIVQKYRPFPFENRSAARTLAAVRGSYLFDFDADRIIQDPESLRASSQRNGSVFEAWHRLKKNLLIQINSSDHNPTVAPGVSPSSAPELSTPWFMQYHIQGGPQNQNQEGYILSNANWDPITITNDIEALTIANANLAAAISQRIQRFSNTFFTVVEPAEVVPAEELANAAPRPSDYILADLMAEIQTLANPVPAQGNAIVRNVEDLQAEGRIKVSRARLATDNVLQLIALDVATSTFWMDVRRIQNPARSFGVAPTPAWEAYRTVVPWQAPAGSRPPVPLPTLAYAFVSANDAASFMREAGESLAKHRTQARKAIKAARAKTLRYARSAKVRTKFLEVQAAEPANR